jgi:thiamine monophosphate kinase
MKIMNYREKSFIQDVLSNFAVTASPAQFDDAIVIDLAELSGKPDAGFLVYSMDQPSFIQHADPDLNPFRFYGRWVAGITCNDVIAMGARCRGFSLALAVPPETEVSDLESLMNGITDVLDRCGAIYEGGNLDNGNLSTVGCAWGVAPRSGIVRRSGARVGDVIAVTGELGFGWLEFQLRKHGLSHQIRPDDWQKFRAYKSMPVGAAAAIAEVAEHGWFTSGMDLSDGLVEFLYTIRQRNDLGCIIDYDLLPVSQTSKENLPLLMKIIDTQVTAVLIRDPALIALEPGYDSPLRHAFTLHSDTVEQARKIFALHDAELRVIGRVTHEPTVLLRREKTQTEIPEFWDDKLRQESILAAWSSFLKNFSDHSSHWRG